jgi:hypothetical protein
MSKKSLVERPLPKGTKIEYYGQEAVILNDDGSDLIDVICEGICEKWWWEFNGVECTVISVPDNAELSGQASRERKG